MAVANKLSPDQVELALRTWRADFLPMQQQQQQQQRRVLKRPLSEDLEDVELKVGAGKHGAQIGPIGKVEGEGGHFACL